MPADRGGSPHPAQGSRLGRWALTMVALVFLGLFLFLPLALVFVYAWGQGAGAWWDALREPDARAAFRLTLTAAAVAVPLNTLFGLAAAWAIARFRFRGRELLVSLIDLPLAVSPVIAGLVFVLLFGARGWLGPWLQEHGLRVIFAPPGIILASLFVTAPFVARELIPLMQTQGSEQEQSALTLGASGFQTFWRVTLPNIKWGLLYGVVLCTARAVGEFGAVSVVSGHIRGQTNTVPLHIEVLYSDYQFTAAFAVASVLAALALATLVVKALVEWRADRAVAAAGQAEARNP
jgi:sulfate transport system permease protein